MAQINDPKAAHPICSAHDRISSALPEQPGNQPRLVRVFVFENFEMLDAIGPLETFANASMIGGALYAVELVSRDGGTVRSSSGLAMETGALRRCERHADTFLVSGGSGVTAACDDPEAVAQVRTAMQAARRAGSVCTGAMLAARTGLLDGMKVVTHWNWCSRLAEANPSLQVEEDAIFLRSGALWTSAGVTAGIDMSLAMIEEDHGPGLALRTAQELIVYLRRPGGQSQFSAELQAQRTREPTIRQVLAAISDNPLADLRVEQLAEIGGMSPRNFSRIFLKETGMTPAAFVTDVRIARACRLLEITDDPIDRIAARCGFKSDDALRRVFLRKKGCSPSAYRERFGSMR